MGNFTKSEIEQTVQVRTGKMSAEGRQFKKPSQQEIYRDAARIVEELLYARLEKNGPSTLHPNCYRTASAENVLSEDMPDDEACNDDEHLVRSQTAPSRFKWDGKGKEKKAKKSRSRAGSKSKKSQDGDSKQLSGVPAPVCGHDTEMAKGDHDSHDKKSPDNSNVERKSSVSQRKKTNLPVNGYCSSSESDGEGRTKKSSPVIRRKKSFFKKAKERLISTFHRDEKSDDDDIYIHGPEKDKKKKRSKHKKVAHDASRFSQGDVSGNATVHADADLKLKVNDVPDGNGASAEHEGPLRRNSAGKRFLDSVRKSFRMKKKSHVPESHSAEPVSSKSGRDYSRSSSTSNDRTSLLNLPMPKAQGLSESETSTTRHPEPARQDQSINVNPGLGRLWPATIPEHGPYDTDFKRRDDKHGPYVTDYKHSDDGKTYVKTDDGLWEQNNPQSGHQGPGGSYLPQISIETDGKDDESDGKTRKDLKGTDDENIPFDEKTESEKEDVIAKVVQKLIEIGDNIAIQSHSSDSESRNRPSTQAQAETTGASAPGDDALSSLEREILECLRVGGDRLSETMEDPTVGLIQEATQSVYDQFTQTIRQTVGDEVNWHQMALVFHASRTALNAVGVGTTKARRLKEMTIKYVTDKCASWIYEQGGWESVVSEDSDLD